MALDESGCTISDLSLHDAAAILLLNNGSAQETSFLDPPGLTKLLNMAFYVRGVDRGATAFLIALDDKAAYLNPNFSWFKEHLTSFVYIDRIVVSGVSRGSGIGRMLYEDLFAAAKRSGHDRVVCEVNLEPPNPASQAFHLAMDFKNIGQATIHDGTKVVRYFEKILT